MKYYVGQVIYVVLRKEAKVYPMQVVEEITKKTLAGEQVNYLVSGGPNNNCVFINEIDGEIFDSADNVKKVLSERAIANIDKIVSNAIKKADEWYKAPHQVQSELLINNPNPKNELPQLESNKIIYPANVSLIPDAINEFQ